MSEHDDALELDAAPEPYMASMLAAYRDEEDMPSDAKARVQRRLESAPVATAGDAAAGGSRGLWIGLGVAAIVATLFVVPRLGGQSSQAPESGAEYQSSELPPTEQALQPAAERDTSPAPAPKPEPEAAATAGPEAVAPLDEVDTAGDAGTHARKRGKASTKSHHASKTDPADEAPAQALSPADSLAEETALLRRAQAALSGGKPRSAFSILREHEQRFPDGVLAEERRALKVVALCDDGQVERGRKQAKVFLAKHPGSALRERVAAACPEASE